MLSRILLFGAGKNLKSFIEKNPAYHKVNIVGIVDNDNLKWGKEIDGIILESPDIIMQISWDWIVITASAFDIIRNQLVKDYGVEREKIVSINDLLVPVATNLGTLKLDCDYDNCYIIKELVPEKISPDNLMEKYFFQDEHRIMNKWWHYFEIYHTFFKKYIGTKVRILEIGVYKGGSMQMWKEYFGLDATIVGIDINPECKEYEEDSIHICIGSQDDAVFLEKVSNLYGPFDIVLDDGSHVMEHQIITFETLFPLVKNGGVYMCEDTHTSYWASHGGGFHEANTFAEYSKNFVDCLNRQHISSEQQNWLPEYSDDIKACHYYDSMTVVEKARRGYSITTEIGY